MTVRTLSAFIASLFIASAVFASVVTASAQLSSPDRPRLTESEFEALLPKMAPPSSLASDLVPIQEAIDRGDMGVAREACDELIKRDLGAFINAYYGWHIKAAAHDYKGQIIARTGGSAIAAFREQAAAMRLGNYPATTSFARSFLMQDPQIYLPASGLSTEELAELFRIGLDFGDAFASAAISFAGLPVPMDSDERVYWALFTVARDNGKKLDERKRLFAALQQKIGLEKVSNIVSRYSRTGGILPATTWGVPGRGVFETLFADGDLLGTFGRGAGQKVEKHTTVPVAPTILEQFDFYSKLVPDVGLGDAYLLVAGSTTTTGAMIIPLEKQQILSSLRPGDRIFVNCGPLAHVSILYKRDIQRRLLYFIDPTYEFWQQSHNSCVNSFDLVEDAHKRYLSVLTEDDVADMLQAVIVARNSR